MRLALPRPDRRLLPIACGLLLALSVPLSAALHNAPPDLPPTWLAAGLATSLAQFGTRRRGLLAMVAALWIGQALAAMLNQGGLADAAPWLWAADGLLAVTQAAVVAGGLRRATRASADLREGRHAAQWSYWLRLLFGLTLPVALLAGAAVAALHTAALPASEAGDPPWTLALLYAAASGLATALLVPLLAPRRQGTGRPLAVVAVVLAALVAVLACLDGGFGVYLMPLVAIAAGRWGGAWLAALACAVVGGGLALALTVHEMSPLEGPDGFVVLLLLLWRLLGTGLLAALFFEQRAVPAGSAGRGARLFRDLPALLRDAAAAGPAGPRVTLVWLGWDGGDEVGPVRVAGRHSLGQATALRRAAASLRAGDAVAPCGQHGLVAVLKEVPRHALPDVLRRLARNVERAPATVAVSGFTMAREAAMLCLRSGAWLELDAADSLPTADAAAAAP